MPFTRKACELKRISKKINSDEIFCLYRSSLCFLNLVLSFILFNAASLEAPEGLFEPGDNPDRRTIKIREGQNTDYNLLAKLLQQASDSLLATISLIEENF